MSSIVVGYDGSSTAEAAVREAGDLAKALDAPLHIVFAVKRGGATKVYEKESWRLGGLDDAEEQIRELSGRLGLGDRVTAVPKYGDPADALTDAAKESGARMIVVGSRGTQGVARVLGSVATGVVKKAPCSVFIAHTS